MTIHRKHADIRAAFEAGARRAGAKSMPLTQSGRAYKLEPGDIQIARIKDGVARTIDEALEIARKQDGTATYKATGGRFYVFATEIRMR